MRLRGSLYSRILLWSLVNVALVLGVLFLFFLFQSDLSVVKLFKASIPDRFNAALRVISHDLAKSPTPSWPAVLDEHAKNFSIDFVVVLDSATSFSSSALAVPEAVREAAGSLLEKLDRADRDQDSDHPQFRDGLGERDKHGKFRSRNPQFPEKRLELKTADPPLYWTGEAVPITDFKDHVVTPAVIFAVSGSQTGNGFFYDPFPWLVIAAAILIISILLWLPLIKNITVPINRITSVAELVGHGKFDVRLEERRGDEIGRLARTINVMMTQLSAFVDGQKNFLRDVSHEIKSPLARIQFGLSSLEQRVDAANKDRVRGILEDVDHMSELVSELIAVARSESRANAVELRPVNLAQLVQEVVLREQREDASIEVDVDATLSVEADPRLLSRAVGNIVRNAMIYATGNGSVRIGASALDGKVTLEIADTGPGVPPQFLSQMFDPFFRIEKARSPGAGGTGLGLAIAKTCILACDGTIFARNATPSGLIVTINLKARAA